MRISYISPAVFVLLVFFFRYYLKKCVPRGYRLPPGPPRHFLFGSAKGIPLEKEWKTYDKWVKTYGDLVYLEIFGTSLLYINSFKLATELMDQRGSIYSNRFKSTMFDLADFDWSMFMMQPHAIWRQRRSLFHKVLGKNAIEVDEYREVWEKNSRKLLQRLYRSPELFLAHIRHTIGANIMEFTYGIEIQDKDDPYMAQSEKVMEQMNKLAKPGSFLVDFLPMLKHVPSWFPGANFKRVANDFKQGTITMRDMPFNHVQTSLRSGKASPSAVAKLLQGLDEKDPSEPNENTEEIIKAMASDVYLAAIDTTEAVIQVFLMAMLLYPEAQSIAQKELDHVVGSNSFSSLRDRPNLPYMNALYKEVLRWHPVAPSGVPHVLARDDFVGDYYIPEGTLVMANIWSILHSEETFGERTNEFRPERFLGKEARVDPSSVFGFGRRICPGRYAAENLVFITISSILHTYKILPFVTESGETILPDADDFEPGALSRPNPFRCRFVPRSPDLETLLERL